MIDTYKKYFAEALNKEIDLNIEDILRTIETTPENIPGDLAFPCFHLSKILKKSPNDITKGLAEKLNSNTKDLKSFSSFESVGWFLNANINQADFINTFLASSNKTDTKNSKTKVLVEYMSANPNKPLHIGQARNICIGDSMRKIYKYLGYTTHTADYGDDSWVNVGYNIVGHLHYDYPIETDMKYDHYCGKIYEEMRKKEEDPEFKKLLSSTLQKIEAGDPEILEIHQKYTKKCTLEQIKSCWRIWASFDLIIRETDILHLKFFAQTMDLLREKGFVTFADKGDAKWCRIIDLSSLPEFAKEEKQYQILIKSDGVATYIAKDIAFALRKLGYLNKDFYYKTFTHEPDGNIIHTTTSEKNKDHKDKFGNYDIALAVIDNRQDPAQKIVKSSLKLLGYTNKKKQYLHLGYGVVYLTPQTLMKLGYKLSKEEESEKRLPFASRKWRTVKLDEMLEMLHQKAYLETKGRNPEKYDKQLDDTAEKIAVSSLRFLLLKWDISKDIVFDIDEALNMEWETWAYILYTWARIQSLIDQGWSPDITDLSKTTTHLSDSYEFNLIKKLSEFENMILQTKEEIAPHLVCRYLLELSSLANSYYAHTKILVDEKEIKDARIYLLQKILETLKKAMDLIGIQFVERM